MDRVLAGLGFAVELAVGLISHGLGSPLSERTPALETRARRLREGAEEDFRAAVFGTAAWCPRFSDLGVLTVAAGAARYSQGTSRTLPIAALTPLRVQAASLGRERTPRMATAPRRLPRSWWVLELSGPSGSAFIAAPLDGLAILGAAAAWPAPPGWPKPGAGDLDPKE